jgi:hypothetical protein
MVTESVPRPWRYGPRLSVAAATGLAAPHSTAAAAPRASARTRARPGTYPRPRMLRPAGPGSRRGARTEPADDRRKPRIRNPRSASGRTRSAATERSPSRIVLPPRDARRQKTATRGCRSSCGGHNAILQDRKVLAICHAIPHGVCEDATPEGADQFAVPADRGWPQRSVGQSTRRIDGYRAASGRRGPARTGRIGPSLLRRSPHGRRRFRRGWPSRDGCSRSAGTPLGSEGSAGGGRWVLRWSYGHRANRRRGGKGTHARCVCSHAARV